MFREQILFLSKEKKYLKDASGRVVAERAGSKDAFYYRAISVKSEAYEKLCISTKPLKVCVAWTETYQCLLWSDVDVCTQYELAPNGFSNIS